MYWNQYSEEKLVELETKISSTLNSAYETFYVPVEFESGIKGKIWTICLNSKSKKTPLVLVHGFAAGIGFWCKNLDDLSKDRPVYAFDLLGFGRSSRPVFSYEASEAEVQMVTAIEEWRKKLNLEKLHLLGHSLGGFLSMSYCLHYPERVKHLVLADPWGFADHLKEKPSFWSSLYFTMVHVRSLEFVRIMGPFGPWLIQNVRADIAMKFQNILGDTSVLPNYVYQCNSQSPTGERAAYSMIWGYGWSKNPMLLRIRQFRKEIPMTFIFGSNTWMDISVGHQIRDLRPDCSIEIKVIEDSGHHLYFEKPEEFNYIVNKSCELHETNNGTTES